MAIPHKQTSAAAAAPAILRGASPLPALPQAAAPPWTDIHVATRHGRVAVRLGHGEGVPLLFLHGNSADKAVFDGQMSGSLRSSCRMIALDLPGHGESENAADPQRSYCMSGYAEAVADVLDALDLSHVALVGWSLGGHVALEVAAAHPGILGVMLCGTPPVGTGLSAILAGFVESPALALAGQATMTPAEIEAFAQLAFGPGEHRGAKAAIARTDGRARPQMFADLVAGGMSDQRAFVEQASLPIAIVNGDDDPIVAADYLKTLKTGSLWYRRVHLIRGGGHAPFRTRPERFNPLLGRFIRSMGRRQRAVRANPDLCLCG